MDSFKEQATQTLFEKKLITDTQFKQVKAYRNLEIFSLNTELKLFLYLSVLFFTTGIGILIYQNIDTIGHIAILSFLLVVAIICYYFSFKNSNGFQKGETSFENPIFDNLILAAVLLTCIFIGYLQYQYNAFGTHYGLATLVPTVIGLFCAYYFDNKSILSIAITGLAAYIGLTVSPQSLLNNNFYTTNTLSYSGIALGVVLVLWSIYSKQIALKKHFTLVYLTFGLHLISISCVNNLFEPHWFVFAVILAAALYYFYISSYKVKSVSLFVFTIIYAYIGVNIILFKAIALLNIDEFLISFFFFVPFYFIISIILFIRLIKKFNKNSNDDSIR
ncbi:DUF2157 domain-containing protein [Flavobacterium hiemivividum]|uniref:DUF2157 domain-containing protein n=1 Tax=Flavobacterium hiemivividum TaxID=2541734 RepID=A0A4R5D311_9FLAO|nr:DUF2157 domain-containing protein [Flavobacterium hiemivividum]TDE05504.1 DUF2157 domain-containing protein [Flavobacterium hiemivividum]